MNKELKFIKIGVGYGYTSSRDGTHAIRIPQYRIEYKVDSDLNRITEITAWQSEDGINLSASVSRTLTRRRSQLFNGIYRNCQLIVMGEGEPVKED